MDIQTLNERIEMLIYNRDTYDCECIRWAIYSVYFVLTFQFRNMASKLIRIYEDMRRHMVAAATEADAIIQELRAVQNPE